jgi:hypothetical protein
VDAVEIDPAIMALGRANHPEHPYDDARVNVINDDARTFFRNAEPQLRRDHLWRSGFPYSAVARIERPQNFIEIMDFLANLGGNPRLSLIGALLTQPPVGGTPLLRGCESASARPLLVLRGPSAARTRHDGRDTAASPRALWGYSEIAVGRNLPRGRSNRRFECRCRPWNTPPSRRDGG